MQKKEIFFTDWFGTSLGAIHIGGIMLLVFGTLMMRAVDVIIGLHHSRLKMS